jgi:hypothetical protein
VNEEQIDIACFNCDGFYSNYAALEELFKMHKILLLQEHWLHTFEVDDALDLVKAHNWEGYFKTFDEMDPVPHTQCRRGQAGTAILWPSALNQRIEEVPDGSDHITGVISKTPDQSSPMS